MSTPHLTDLISAAPDALLPLEAPSVTISHLTADSRDVRPGSLFAALKGTKFDGTRFIDAAIKAGASAILCDMDTPVDSSILAVRSANPRRSLAQMAAAFYPRQPEKIVAITGTDGKTSTADFYRQLWNLLGESSASIGTLGILTGAGETLYAESQTTPGPVLLHKQLAEMAGKGITHLGMEASSHGLDQYRLDGVKLAAGAFTNIARDHLDYHHTEAEYFAAKARLFSEVLPQGATAVLNQDDARFSELKAICEPRNIKVIGFGARGEQYTINSITPKATGQLATLTIHGMKRLLDVPLAGGFQVFNLAAALALVEATGGNLEQALAAVPSLRGVPGRLECVGHLANGAAVYIDYAHTPMALANILRTLRPHTAGRLHVVFGCGGDRDPGKRAEMGKVACELADIVIVTDDNPRSEDPASIRKAVLAACDSGKEVADRRQAIYGALEALGAGDVLVVAGKGHEKTQTIGDVMLPFDDAEVVREGIRELKLAA